MGPGGARYCRSEQRSCCDTGLGHTVACWLGNSAHVESGVAPAHRGVHALARGWRQGEGIGGLPPRARSDTAVVSRSGPACEGRAIAQVAASCSGPGPSTDLKGALPLATTQARRRRPPSVSGVAFVGFCRSRAQWAGHVKVHGTRGELWSSSSRPRGGRATQGGRHVETGRESARRGSGWRGCGCPGHRRCDLQGVLLTARQSPGPCACRAGQPQRALGGRVPPLHRDCGGANDGERKLADAGAVLTSRARSQVHGLPPLGPPLLRLPLRPPALRPLPLRRAPSRANPASPGRQSPPTQPTR